VGGLDLAIDLPTNKVTPVSSLPNVNVRTLRNRRIYFLAVNHRNPALQNVDLPQAISHAIDRQKILNDAFRADFRDKPDAPHRILSGPYPPDSWAYNRTLPEASHDQAVAKARMAAAAKSVNQTRFSLKYLDGDAQVKQACEAISAQVKSLVGIELALEPCSPQKLRQDVEVTHRYDFAYYHYDYPGETYWLWPLFNPSDTATGPGGPNFLGYTYDRDLTVLLQKANDHRSVAALKDITHEIDRQFRVKLPFIPLWQLDTHIAWKSGLQFGRLDPLHVFADVGQWELTQR
jgi:ABC-type transport system substrate-binding protein